MRRAKLAASGYRLLWMTVAAIIFGSSIPTYALTDNQTRVYDSGSYYYDTDVSGGVACASAPSSSSPAAPSTATNIDLQSIVSKYNLQSVIVKQVNGAVIGSSSANQPPATPASVLKLLITDVLLHTGVDINKTVSVQSQEIYAPGDATAGQTYTLSNVIQKTLSDESWDTGANMLIDAAGGFAAVTASAHQLGYNSTDVVTYYHDPPQGKNTTTVSDLTKVMEDIFTQTGKYSVAQNAMTGENHFNISPTPVASKWGGTSKVTGNSAVFNLSNAKYIVTLYANEAYNSSPPTQGFNDIKNASEAIVNAVINSSSQNGGSVPATCCQGIVNFGAGGLPPSVPAPYNGIFTAAANKFQISPALLAAIFYGGEHGSNWPDPPPPYGHGSLWASSGAPSPGGQDWPTQPPGPGAAGPFQFEYPTWQGDQQDGNGDGKKDVEDLADAAFGAAYKLANDGAKDSTNPTDLKRAILAYNNAQFYLNDVMAAYLKFSGSGGTTAAPVDSGGSCGSANGGLINPFPGGWIPNRLDMGYDGTFKGQIVAPFSGTLTYASNSFSNWGGYMEIRADQQPSGLPTSTLYFAEGISPTVRSGHVNVGQPIATPAPSPYGNAYNTTPDGSGQIEWGVAADGASVTDPYAEATLGAGKCPDSTPKSRSMVLAFAQWAEQSLGLSAPSSTGDAGCA